MYFINCLRCILWNTCLKKVSEKAHNIFSTPMLHVIRLYLFQKKLSPVYNMKTEEGTREGVMIGKLNKITLVPSCPSTLVECSSSFLPHTQITTSSSHYRLTSHWLPSLYKFCGIKHSTMWKWYSSSSGGWNLTGSRYM